MNSTADQCLDTAKMAEGSVCTDEGVYYARIRVPGQSEPVRVALHGVTTASQAAQALESFARLFLTAPAV